MTEIENDSISVDSGSCDCSEYNSDMSWFYNSKNLQESSTHFSIIQNKKKSIEEKNIIINDEIQDKKNEEINQFPLKANLNQEPQKIFMPKNIKSENDIQNNDTNLNIAKKFTNYRSKYRMALKNKNEENQKDEGYNSDTNNENKNKNENNDEQKEENTRFKYRHLTHKININKKIDINNTENENKGGRINFYRRFHADNKEKNNEIEQDNNDKEKDDEISQDNNKDKIQTNPTNESFRTKFFNSYKNFSRFRGKYKEEREKEKEKEKDKENNTIKEEKNKEPLKEQIRLKTLKEKIVNETKNLPLQPGQTIKPKIVTTRKLKPITNIVTNDDGTQNIIIENTTLTTTIINEILDESNMENDEYPLDIQLVRQHITKKYVTEIESNPYNPKKRFSHFNRIKANIKFLLKKQIN